VLLAVIVSAGFGEELVWRGFLFNRLGSWWGRGAFATGAAVTVSAILFAAAHWQDQGLPGAEQALVTGLVFGAIFARTRSLAFVMIAHASFDLVAVGMIYAGWEERVTHLFLR
jgi:membrane protease YdiL (CAAX protease family)